MLYFAPNARVAEDLVCLGALPVFLVVVALLFVCLHAGVAEDVVRERRGGHEEEEEPEDHLMMPWNIA